MPILCDGVVRVGLTLAVAQHEGQLHLAVELGKVAGHDMVVFGEIECTREWVQMSEAKTARPVDEYRALVFVLLAVPRAAPGDGDTLPPVSHHDRAVAILLDEVGVGQCRPFPLDRSVISDRRARTVRSYVHGGSLAPFLFRSGNGLGPIESIPKWLVEDVSTCNATYNPGMNQ